MTLAWLIGALVMFFASFVLGLAGFGIALVAMAFLPYSDVAGARRSSC